MKDVSISKFDEAAKGCSRGKFEDEWNGLKIIVTPYLEPEHAVSFAENVADSCFQGDDEVYMPALKDFALRVATIASYTNIRLPDSNQRKSDMVYGTDIFDWLLDRIHLGQFNEIIAAIDSLVDYKLQVKQNDVRRELRMALDKIEQMVDSVDSFVSGVNPDDIGRIAGAVVNSKIDEEKLMAAYLDKTSASRGDDTQDDTDAPEIKGGE